MPDFNSVSAKSIHRDLFSISVGVSHDIDSSIWNMFYEFINVTADEDNSDID